MSNELPICSALVVRSNGSPIMRLGSKPEVIRVFRTTDKPSIDAIVTEAKRFAEQHGGGAYVAFNNLKEADKRGLPYLTYQPESNGVGRSPQ